MLLLTLIGLCQLFLNTNARRVFPCMLHLTANQKSFSLVELYFLGDGNLVLSQSLSILICCLSQRQAKHETFLYKHDSLSSTQDTFDAGQSQLNPKCMVLPLNLLKRRQYAVKVSLDNLKSLDQPKATSSNEKFQFCCSIPHESCVIV